MSGWRNNRSPGCFCAGLVLLALGACGKPAAPNGTDPFLRLSQRNEPATLDPQLATLPDEFFIIRALGEGLLTPAPDGSEAQPAVAASWTLSPDGRIYTFELRPDARWSNGDPVTAGDFVYSIHRMLSPALAAPKAALFFALKNAEAYWAARENDFAAVGVRALSDHRLELTLTEPTTDFLALVASGPWIPVHPATIERAGGMDRRSTAWTRPENYVGNGPFRLSAWQPNQVIIVIRNPNYRAAAQIKLPGIRFLAFDNGDSEERAFRAGQLDVTMSVPFTKLPAYRSVQPPVLRSVAQYETRYLALNTTKPPLNDARVRRALALALDRRALTEKVLAGGQQPAFTFIPAGLGGYQSQSTLTENIPEARRLLAEAGFPDGRGFPQLELTAWYHTPVLEAIQQRWRRDLGVTVTLAQREARTHLAALAAADYDLALMTAIPDYAGASDLFTQLKRDAPTNYPHWHNAEFDRLVTAAGRMNSSAQRNATYQLAEKILLEDLPLIPLYFNTQNFLIRPAVKNWQTDQLWTRFYLLLSLR